MAHKMFRVRFLLDDSDRYYSDFSDSNGWIIDAIAFSEVASLENHRVSR